MASGKNGHLGVYALLHVEKANEQGQGPALLHSTGEDCVVDQKFNISLAILLFAQLMVSGRNGALGASVQ